MDPIKGLNLRKPDPAPSGDRVRLRKGIARGLQAMLEASVPPRSCFICGVPEAFDALYEFARARELLRTTQITYSEFRSQYMVPVFGPVITKDRMNNCLRKHVRPSLRREAYLYELEHARRHNKAPEVRDIDDFCLGRPMRSQFRLTCDGEENINDTSPLGEEPVAPASPDDIRLHEVAEVVDRLYPDCDQGETLYKLLYWEQSIRNDRKNTE